MKDYFKIAVNVRKATAADGYYRRIVSDGWTPILDGAVRDLSGQYHLAEAARLIGLPPDQLRDRANKLGVSFLPVKEAREPTKGEWIHYATVAAAKAGLQPRVLLSGCRALRYAKARWEAWEALHKEHPEYSIAGIARVSGHHHVTVLKVLARLAAE